MFLFCYDACMETLPNEALRHVLPEQRDILQEMYKNGDFGAHTLAVHRMLSVTRVNAKEMFAHGEEYLPHAGDLPNNGLATFFRMMSMLIHLSTAQRSLAMDVEEYCKSEPHALNHDVRDLRQRFVWERSDELAEPFWE